MSTPAARLVRPDAAVADPAAHGIRIEADGLVAAQHDGPKLSTCGNTLTNELRVRSVGAQVTASPPGRRWRRSRSK